MLLHVGGIGTGTASPTTLLSDDFSEADATSLSGKALDVGGTWTVHAGTLTVQSGKARTGSAPGQASADPGQADYTASVAATATADAGGQGLMIRHTDANNCWILWLNYDSSALELYKVQSGSASLIATTPFNPAANTAYALAAVCSGNTITCTVDGANSISNGGDSFNATVKPAGIRGYRTVAENHDFDNFLVTT